MDTIGKYHILKRLGSGGFGEVFLAQDPDLQEDVAIKLFKPKDANLISAATSNDQDGLEVLRQRFLNEARILAKLRSNPNIVDVLEFGRLQDGSPWYAMPYLPSSLKDQLGVDIFDTDSLSAYPAEQHPKALPVDQALSILQAICSGMAAAHGAGLVHRDIKPANILLTPESEIRIADFGIAKAPDSGHSTVSQVGMGSRNYMAPEQHASAKYVDARADVYSLGVLAYRMLTGKLPEGRYADPNVHANINQALNDCVLTALSHNKTERPANAGELLQAVQQAAATQELPQDETSTGTDISAAPVFSVPGKLRPLYDVLETVLLEEGTLEGKQGEIQAMATLLDQTEDDIQGLIQQIQTAHPTVSGLMKLRKLLSQKHQAGATAEVVIQELTPAAKLVGKDADWLRSKLPSAEPIATPAPKQRVQAKPKAAAQTPPTAKPQPSKAKTAQRNASEQKAKPTTAAQTSNAQTSQTQASKGNSKYLLLALLLLAGGGGLYYATKQSPADVANSNNASKLKPFENYQDCSTCPKMVVVPAGRFQMGSDGEWSEKPVHSAYIRKAFGVGKYEITWNEWQACVAGDGCSNKGPDKAGGDEGWGKGTRPVINVSWNDAQAYVKWLSTKTGKAYRLLTESEWEYTARAGSTTKYSFGDSESNLCRYANGADESTGYSWANKACSDGYAAKTAPVGSFQPNRFGLYDMHGNVTEWVQDCYQTNYNDPPLNGKARQDCDTQYRTLRGGSFNSEPGDLRSANRFSNSATVFGNVNGFRVAQDL